MKIIDGGVTSAKGFSASAAQAGIKYKERNDMALVFSQVPAVVGGTFTTNVVKAAPVKWDISLIGTGKKISAVVLNSGVANACTGEMGDLNNELMAKAVAETLSVPTEAVLTASTGVIGRQLPMDAVVYGAGLLKDALADTKEAGHLAAKAIMTTDTVEKECAVTVMINNKEITIGGMSKGSGMIHPDMATMLGVVTTDAAISKEMLQKAISTGVKDSFNMISVDRDTSTNDSLIIMANGLAGNDEIKEAGQDYDAFYEGLEYILKTLAKKMAADGEGASKLFECKVINAVDKAQAVTLAKSVITSSLVKSAVFGNDANWGRILCALGYSGAAFNPDLVDLIIEGHDEEGRILTEGSPLMLVQNGMATDYSEKTATQILSSKYVTAIADMKLGKAEATAWGCDLTYDYIKINADYRS